MDLVDRIMLEVDTGTKTTRTGISKVVSDLKELRTGMNSSMTSIRNLQSQFKELGVNLSKSTLKSSISTINSDVLRYVTSSNQLVTVNRKVKNGLDTYTVSLKNMNNELKKGTSLWGAFTKGISGAIVQAQIVLGTLKGVVNNVTDLVKSATEYEESLNLFTVSMGEQAEEATLWIERFSEALYLDPSNVMQYMGSLNSLISGLGVGADDSYLMSKNLTQLAYDLASFKNMNFEEAFTKLQSGISGEIEPLRNVGVALSQATLQELANSLGIQQRVAEMSEAEKAQLRYIQIIKSTTQWQGDMGRTLVSPANAVRVLREQFTLLGRAVGRIFIPMIMKAIPYVMALTEILTDLANRIAAFFGYEFTDIDYSSLGNISTGISNIGTAAADTTNKLNTMLAPFDELNVVQNQSKNTGSGLGGIGGDLGLDLPEYDALAGLTDQFKKNVESAKENLEKIFDIAGKIAIVLAGVWAIDKLLKFKDNLARLFGIITPGNTKLTGLKNVINKLSENFKKGYKNSNSLWGGLKNIFGTSTNLIRKIGGTAGLAVSIFTAANNMKDLGNKTKDTDDALIDFLGSVIGGVGSGFVLGGPIGALAGGLITVASSLIGFGHGLEEAKRKALEADIFGDLNVSVESFKDMLDKSGPSLDNTMDKIDSLTETIKTNRDAFNNNLDSVDDYLYRFGTLGQVITDEYGSTIINSFNSLFDNANAVIDANTEKSVEIWSSGLKNMTSISVEEQAKILNNITSSGESRKKEINEAETRINKIWATASNERRSLTKDEIAEIETLLNKIKQTTQVAVTDAEANVYALRADYADKNYELDKESYKNFKTALEEYNTEKTEEINKWYGEAIVSAKNFAQDEYNNIIANNGSKIEAEKAYQETYNYWANIAEQSRKERIEGLNTFEKEETRKLVDDLIIKYNGLATSTEKNAQKQRKVIEGIFKQIDPTIINELKMQCDTALGNIGQSSAEQFIQNAQNGFNKSQFNFSTNNFDMNSIASTGVALGNVLGNGMAGPLRNIITSTITNAAGKKFKVSTDSSGNITVKPYANGGFPKTGEFFMAREAGPEMVGRIGNQTAVANNDQITTSITNALITALNNYNFGGKSGTTVVNIGGRKVYEGVGDYVDSENDRYGTNYVHI